MPLFGRKPTLDEAIDAVIDELRNGNPSSGEMLAELRRREQPLLSGGREPPGLQELLERSRAAPRCWKWEAGWWRATRRWRSLLGRAPPSSNPTRSAELQDVCARGLAGWAQRRELSRPLARFRQLEAQVSPLTHARALLVFRAFDRRVPRRSRPASRLHRQRLARAAHAGDRHRGPRPRPSLDGGLQLPEQAAPTSCR